MQWAKLNRFRRKGKSFAQGPLLGRGMNAARAPRIRSLVARGVTKPLHRVLVDDLITMGKPREPYRSLYFAPPSYRLVLSVEDRPTRPDREGQGSFGLWLTIIAGRIQRQTRSDRCPSAKAA